MVEQGDCQLPSPNCPSLCSSGFPQDCYGNPECVVPSMLVLFWPFFLLTSKLTNHSFLHGDQVVLLGPVRAVTDKSIWSDSCLG